jgi:hypothetical protein
MGIYPDVSVIYGVRILEANEEGDYFTVQEFADGHWKEGARQALLTYEEHPTKKVQLLYSCQTTYAEKPFLLWMDNTRTLAELLLLLV